MAAGDKKPDKKWRRLIGVVFSVASLAIFTYIAVTLISGRSLSMDWFTGMFSPRTRVEAADEFNFEVGRSRSMADMGGAVAAVGTLGIQVLDIGGNELLRVPYIMSHPAINSANGRAIAFDIGGTSVKVFDRTQIISSIDVQGTVIVSASINNNGWYCVSTQGSSGFGGVATVYNDRNIAVYRVSLGSGYVLAAHLSPDNRSLAVLNLTDDGSRITFYHGLNKQEPDNAFNLPGGLILDMHYLPNGDLLAVSTYALVLIDRNGASSSLYEYFDKRLGGYSFDGDSVALYLLDHGVGFGGSLLTLDGQGRISGQRDVDREILSMSLSGGCLAVLGSDGVVFFDSELREFPQSGEQSAAGVNKVIVLGIDNALAIGEHSAVVIKRGEGGAE